MYTHADGAVLTECEVNLHMTVKEYLICTTNVFHKIIQIPRQRVECEDGFTISIQAGSGFYCFPRENRDDGEYTHLELGFPNQREELIEKYEEDGIYPFVPVEVVEQMIKKHGGFRNAKRD